MTLGTPQDVTLQELRIETFFPADVASEQVWRELAVGGATTIPAAKLVLGQMSSASASGTPADPR